MGLSGRICMSKCEVCGGIGDHKVYAADGVMWLCCLCYIKLKETLKGDK